MKLSTKGRYALNSMLDIAKYSNGNKDVVSLVGISKRNEISVPYLEQLFIKLRKANLVISSKGAKGGYVLSRPASEITIMQIFDAVGEKIEMLKCNHKATCLSFNTKQVCNSHDLLDNLLVGIHHYLSSITLEQIITNTINTNFVSNNNINMYSSPKGV